MTSCIAFYESYLSTSYTLSAVKVRLFTYRKEAARVNTSPLSKYRGLGTLVLRRLDELTGSRGKMSITRKNAANWVNSCSLLSQYLLKPTFGLKIITTDSGSLLKNSLLNVKNLRECVHWCLSFNGHFLSYLQQTNLSRSFLLKRWKNTIADKQCTTPFLL